MTNNGSPVHTAEVVSPGMVLTVTQVCQSCKVDRVWISEMVSQGVLEPEGQSETEWQFNALHIRRIAIARRLERDFSLNAPGIALALQLLDEIEALRARLRSLEPARKGD